MEEKKRKCFVIMPISDTEGYNKGHFTKVYEHLIKPACELAELEPDRVDDSKASDIIHRDIFNKLLNSPMAICDISSKNPNVFFELGIRLALNKPVTIIKDNKTTQVFDIGIIKYINYDSELQYGEVIKSQKDIADSLIQTFERGGIALLDSFVSRENLSEHTTTVKPAGGGLKTVRIDDILPELLERYMPDILKKFDQGK